MVKEIKKEIISDITVCLTALHFPESRLFVIFPSECSTSATDLSIFLICRIWCQWIRQRVVIDLLPEITDNYVDLRLSALLE